MNPFFALTLVAATSSGPVSADLANTLFARGDLPAAAMAYQARLRAHPRSQRDELGLAAIRLYENDLGGAEFLLRAVAAEDPENPRAQRLLGELNRRKTEATRSAVVAGRESDVPFITSDPLPVVHVVANGVPANFLVDTGADVVLEPDFAQRLGVKTTDAGSGIFAGGERAPMARGMLASLALGGATAGDVPVHVMNTHAAELFPQLRIDGIVGTTYFERFLVTMDYPRNELVIRPRTAQVSAAFETEADRLHATIVPCYLAGDHFVMANAQVNDAPPGLFLFDSGLAGGGLMPSADLVSAAKLGLDRSSAITGVGGGGAVTAIPFVAARIAVGDAVQANVRGLYTPAGSPFTMFPFTVWGAISNDFLRNYAYTVDFDAMKIVLTASAS